MHEDSGLGQPGYGPPGGYQQPGAQQPGGSWPGAGQPDPRWQDTRWLDTGWQNTVPPPPGGARRRGGVLSHAIVAVLAAAAAVAATLAVYHPAPAGSAAAPSAAGPVPGASAVPRPSAPAGSAAPGSEQALVNAVQPGLVLINTTLQYSSEAAAGTGMVINADGLVLTNNHVIDDSTKITATVTSTGRTYPASVVGYDRTGDVALIQLQGASGLRTVPLGNSASVTNGASVLALGNAEGRGSISPAGGQVTALNQTITASDEGGTAASETLRGMIQVNADVVPGDSGGALVSASGQVIGMNTAGNDVTAPGAQATGFAIPINTALSVARQIAGGRRSPVVSIGYPPFLGIFTGTGPSSSPLAQAEDQAGQQGFGDGSGGFGGFNGFGGGGGGQQSCYTSNSDLAIPSDIAPVSSGTLVDGTICGGPADAAGLTGGSVITAVNGQPVGAPATLSTILAGLRPGQTIAVTWVSPAGQQSTSQLRLTAGPPQ
jgi:S1-C subfamily serine protease